MSEFNNCVLCPRKCGVNRHSFKGFCKAGDKIKVATASLHHWEEPIISGQNGSGTIFFSNCNLLCVYCQNKEISQNGFGCEITCDRLAEIFLELEDKGAHNINLVTPTPYTPLIKTALDKVKNRLTIPVIYNCGGYENPGIIKELEDYIDIYLTDFKYYDKSISKKYSYAEDYLDIATKSLSVMIKTKDKPVIVNGIMKSGVIVRHLVLPSHRKDSVNILFHLNRNFNKNDFILSIMAQYFPPHNLTNFPEINRKITTFEYDYVVNKAIELGFDNAYIQERSSADKNFVPKFDLSGVDLVK